MAAILYLSVTKTDLFVIEMGEILCTCICKIVNLLKSNDIIHGMTYITKIMLSGIAIINTGYFDNTNCIHSVCG